MLKDIGKLLLIAGGFLVILGLIFTFLPQIPFLGRLPGDIHISKDSFTFFFPLVTCLVISVVLTIIVNIILRLFK